MVSPVVALRDAIVTAWEAATPPDRTESTYHHMGGWSSDDHDPDAENASSDRGFYFVPVSGGEVGSQTTGLELITHTFEARLHLATESQTLAELAAAAWNEAVLLIRDLNHVSKPANVRSVRATGYRVDALDNSTIMLVINIRARTEESD